MTDEQLLEYRRVKLLERDKQISKLVEENSKLREDLREDLREGISLRDATNDGLRKEIASLRTANDRQEADLRLAKTALAETMKLFNNQPNDSGLRDHFASLAMQGLIIADGKNDWDICLNAYDAYRQADAMMAERGKNGN
jgi:hypothetical protein